MELGTRPMPTVSVVPSPKIRRQLVLGSALPLPEPLKVTLNGASPVVGDALRTAGGGWGQVSTHVTTSLLNVFAFLKPSMDASLMNSDPSGKTTVTGICMVTTSPANIGSLSRAFRVLSVSFSQYRMFSGVLHSQSSVRLVPFLANPM